MSDLPAANQDPKPQEIGGDHYQQGVSTSPWDLQLSMKSSGSAYVDARRADAIKYAFRMKGDLKKLAEDLRKAADCALAGAKEIEAILGKTPSSIISKMEFLPWRHLGKGELLAVIDGYSYRVLLGNPEAAFNKWELQINGILQQYADSQWHARQLAEHHWKTCPETPSSI